VKIRLVRVIGRLNVGGPAIQAITLSKRMDSIGYETTLVRGMEGLREGSMDYLAERLAVAPVRLRSLRRELGPRDFAALARLTALLRSLRPHVLHTHAAKAGALGRMAAALSGSRGPRVTVHTFHGHVLSGYFSRPVASAFTGIERALARRTSRLVAVSPEVHDDLVRLRIAPPGRISVVRLGFDLAPFDVSAEERALLATSFRRSLGIPPNAQVVTLVARLVPIKRVDRFLELALRLRERENVHFVVVGDGELAEPLRTSEAARGLGPRLVWAGLRRGMPAVMAATDVAVLTSDNEGTPVSLIEAQAAGVPVVSTRVGGVASAVRDRETGVLVDRDDVGGLAAGVETLLRDPDLAAAWGRAGRGHALADFSLDRLVSDLDRLYRDLLAGR
jgi:glycosyltransferase involved in cell wall biosynthesis